MNKTISIYQTLNEREKYILSKLEIEEKDLLPEYRDDVLTVMLRMTKRISELPITDEQLHSTLKNYLVSHDKFFKGVEYIVSEEDYPKIKVNVFRTLSNESKEVMKILGIEIEDREMTSKEYAEKLQILGNKQLIKFGTGIKQKECYKLIDKIAKILE